jgi:Na+/phosphate symporter
MATKTKTGTEKHQEYINKLQAEKVRLEKKLQDVVAKLRKEVYRYDKDIIANFKAEEY